MKTIGLLGGLSWHSTIDYYRLFNEITHKQLGGNYSAKMLIYSFNFQEVRDLHAESEEKLSKRLTEEAQKLEQAGADCLLIGANTIHMFYDDIQQSISIPVIHIAEAVGKVIQQKGLKKVALLGTKHTMERPFYAEKLKQFAIETITPDQTDRNTISDIIYKELVNGTILPESKAKYLDIIDKMVQKENIEGVILGCTEIPLLIQDKDLNTPAFNSTEIHANEAVNFALGR